MANNTLSRNALDGLHIGSGYPGELQLVEGNRADRNGDDGIEIAGLDSGITGARNRARFNKDFGIEAAEGVIDGGGNRAFDNGNPLQCLNGVCK